MLKWRSKEEVSIIYLNHFDVCFFLFRGKRYYIGFVMRFTRPRSRLYKHTFTKSKLIVAIHTISDQIGKHTSSSALGYSNCTRLTKRHRILYNTITVGGLLVAYTSYFPFSLLHVLVNLHLNIKRIFENEVGQRLGQ